MSDYRSMFDRKYIGAWDSADDAGKPRDVTVTIASVKAETLKNRQGENKKPVVYFRGTDKGFALNKSNGAAIAGMYGPNTKDWIGKRITLFPTQVTFGASMVDAIRVRPTIPKSGAPNGKLSEREMDPEMRAMQEAAAEAVAEAASEEPS